MTATDNPDEAPYEAAARAGDELGTQLGGGHDVAVVLGSGWREAARSLGSVTAQIETSGLSGFVRPTVSGHRGEVWSVTVGGRRVLLLLGRIHLYEGCSPARVVHPVRAAVANGCGTLILTNAAGSLRPEYGAGTPVLISDHLNLTGQSPLGGPEPPTAFGPRFCDLTDLYPPHLRALAREVDGGVGEGVYACLPGPHYETPAEVRMLRALGADLVGMSTVLEAIAARHAGAQVLGISLVTNLAAGVSPEPLDHGEVLAAGAAASDRMAALLRGVIERL